MKNRPFRAPLTLRKVFNKVEKQRQPEWNRLPGSSSSGMWCDYNAGRPGLGRMLQACPDPRLFLSSLLFSCLLGPSEAPDYVLPWLGEQEVCRVLGCALPLEELQSITWRRVAVPLVGNGRGGYEWMMTGIGEDLPLFPVGSDILDDVAEDAVVRVGALFFGKWGKKMAVWPMVPGSAGRVTGRSLGLPLYLGAEAARLKLPNHRVAATGALGESGAVLRVGGVQEKLNALPQEIPVFLHPRDMEHAVCAEPDSGRECVPVDTVEQAVSVLQCNGPGLAAKVIEMHTELNKGTGVARSLCGLKEGMDIWVRHNHKKICRALSADDGIGELIGQIGKWCHSTTGSDGRLGGAVLDCMDVKFGRSLAGKSARYGWDLALLKMDRANHSGAIDACADWKKVAEGVRPKIMMSAGGKGEHLVYYVRTTIGDCHNRYRFDPDLPGSLLESMSLGRALKAREDEFADNRSGYGCFWDSVLGRYYGTMGQHFLFCGPEFHDRGMAFLNKAMAAFGDGVLDDCRDEWERDRFYCAFGLLEAGQFQEAEELLSELCGRGGSQEWPVEDMNSFWLLALLRLHVDCGTGLNSSLAKRLAVSVSKRSGHPGQLLAYNYARLLSDPKDRRHWYTCSVQRCLNRYTGPTIRAMALLPLSRMHAEGMDLPDMGEKCDEVRSVLECAGLHTDHFRCALNCGTWQEMLEVVVASERELFPYMYR